LPLSRTAGEGGEQSEPGEGLSVAQRLADRAGPPTATAPRRWCSGEGPQPLCVPQTLTRLAALGTLLSVCRRARNAGEGLSAVVTVKCLVYGGDDPKLVAFVSAFVRRSIAAGDAAVAKSAFQSSGGLPAASILRNTL
jgi:hypothetical protein